MSHSEVRNRVLCTWELGDQLGHIARLSHLSRALEARGYQCALALKDLSRANPFFQNSPATLLQAPVFLPKIKMQRPIMCLADTLLLSGYLKTEELQGLVQAWRNLIELVNPDILIMDYSPTAALAALDLPIKKVMVGTGFWQPVPGQPMRSWFPQKAPQELVARQENMVVDRINTLLGSRQQSAIKYVGDLFAADRTIISTPPEFDLYGDLRADAINHCNIGGSDISKPVQFQPGSLPKVLAYLKPSHPQFDLIVAGLARSAANVFVACPRCDPKRLQAYASDKFTFSVEPVQLAAAMNQAALFVGHANIGSSMESLFSHTPMISLPIQLEQLLTAQTLDQVKVGHSIHKVESAEQMAKTVEQALSSDELKQNTIRYAQQNAHLTQVPLGEMVADECDSLVKAIAD